MILYFILFSVIAAYLVIKWRLKYWERKGLFYDPPKHALDGTLKFGKERHAAELLHDNYIKWKNQHRLYGSFILMRPTVIINDFELAKTVMTTDSHYFQTRGLYVNTQDDPLSGHLFALEGERWKKLREKLTSVFTSGKMKFMFSTVLNIADELIAAVDKELKISDEVEIKDLFARFTTDVIGNVAFGLECNTLKDPNAKFREMGKKTLDVDIWRQVLVMLVPKIAKRFHMTAFNKEVTDFYVQIVNETVKYREENGINRNDFMDLLIKMRNKDKSNDDKDEHMSGLSINEIVAQAFIFFVAGFETSSSTLTYAVYELALNQEIQQKARDNVNEVLAKHKGEFSYEAIMEMTYVNQCIDEALRKYPAAAFAFRSTSSDWRVPDTDVVIDKGTQVWIPVYSFHHDSEYYPNPEVFDPDRFKFEEGEHRTPYGYIPFGLGPRNCIGLRFGLMQSRIGLAKFVKNYKFNMSMKTDLPLKFVTNMAGLSPRDGVYVKMERI